MTTCTLSTLNTTSDGCRALFNRRGTAPRPADRPAGSGGMPARMGPRGSMRDETRGRRDAGVREEGRAVEIQQWSVVEERDTTPWGNLECER